MYNIFKTNDNVISIKSIFSLRIIYYVNNGGYGYTYRYIIIIRLDILYAYYIICTYNIITT
jgi:hypothetical protein